MNKRLSIHFRKAAITVVGLLLSTGCVAGGDVEPSISPSPTQGSTPVFVALGDYGSGDSNQRRVSESISNINPEWFVSLGDNVYSQDGYQALVGDYYEGFLNESKFLPATGNHDYKEGISNFDSYFGIANQARYYKATISSDIDVFVLDSQSAINSQGSLELQKTWLTEEVKLSKAKYKFVVLHHPPFSSGKKHGSNKLFQWDFSNLGITAVLSGHEHLYERLEIEDVTYLISGAGGKDLYKCGQLISTSDLCIEDTFGAVYFFREGESLRGKFISATGKVLDSFELN